MVTKSPKNIDYLDEDPIIENQKYCCFSFLSSRNVKNCSRSAFKFRGAFPTLEAAQKHAEEIQQKLDSDFHVFVGEGFKWMEFDPDPDAVETQEYKEKELNELMKSYKEQMLIKKQHESDRKKQKIEQAMVQNEELKKKNRLREKLQKKHAAKHGVQETMEEKKRLATEEEVKDQLAKIDAEEKELDDKQKNVNELTAGLQKMQEVYAKLLDKSKAGK